MFVLGRVVGTESGLVTPFTFVCAVAFEFVSHQGLSHCCLSDPEYDVEHVAQTAGCIRGNCRIKELKIRGPEYRDFNLPKA